MFSSVKFTGTLFVDTYVDDDVVGFIFNYQDNKNFYLVSSSKQGSGQVHYTSYLNITSNISISRVPGR